MFIGVSEGYFEIILAILESILRINNRVCVCWFVVQLSKVQKIRLNLKTLLRFSQNVPKILKIIFKSI